MSNKRPGNRKVYQQEQDNTYPDHRRSLNKSSSDENDSDYGQQQQEYCNDDYEYEAQNTKRKFMQPEDIQNARQFIDHDVRRLNQDEQQEINDDNQQKKSQKQRNIDSKSKKLEEILKRSAKRMKKEQNNDVEDQELEKIKETYKRYLSKKKTKSQQQFDDNPSVQKMKKRQQSGGNSINIRTKRDIEAQLQMNYESNRTVGLFIINIFILIMIMFTLVGVVMLSLIVYIADDEVDILHSLPGQEYSMLHFNIFRPSIALCVIPVVIFLALNIYLISCEPQDEMYFYLANQQRGNVFLSVATTIMTLISTGCLVVYSLDKKITQQISEDELITIEVHLSHLFLTTLALVQVAALKLLSSSKSKDAIEGQKEHLKRN